jgi:hypothetical protein
MSFFFVRLSHVLSGLNAKTTDVIRTQPNLQILWNLGLSLIKG